MYKRFYSFIVLFTAFLMLLPFHVLADKVELNLTNEEIAFTFFDLTHGESTLIQGNNDETILINTGHRNSQEELMERLEMYNVTKINTLILTSKQAEYIGNLSWVLKQYPVDNIIIPESLQSKFSPIFKDLLDKISVFKKGDHFSVLKDLEIDILYVEDREGIDKGGSAFFIKHFNQKLLYMTVANLHVEEELVKEYDLKSTMFKVPDFGSDSGTSEYLLDEVDPQIAVIFRNGENHPSNFVLERLEETWIDIYQTSRIGTVTIKCDEDDYEIITVRPSGDHSSPKNWFTRHGFLNLNRN